ncbi:hypothetical protein GCM10011584_09970 [Nocardioides phosphati]|uniref:DUF1697 domain-containing protein n=1 Tax=Nocardioides phosphati TaxID=1867775 RepID=A0ABQ2N8H2_9ACTN|nr:DUF1697 domain-containing protein [Nocardioides phosphati]GGO86823.1 hypothetical protein GCM10011584_09970 [Nocardioides phosphati]
MSDRYVALLRGINVGGNNKIVMKELAEAFREAGYADVSTYINSGNVLFSAPKRPTEEELEKVITDAFGLTISVLVRSHDEIAKVVAKAPKELDDPDVRPDVYFLRPGLSPADALERMPDPNPDVDRLWKGPGVLYTTRVAELASKSRLTKVVGTKLYKEMSVRNWNTTRKLLALLEA